MKKSAFTLIELMAVIAIIGILGVSFAPAIGDAVMKARVAKTIGLIDTLEVACEMYHGDTSNYPYEYGSSGYAAQTYHQLSYNPGLTNWNGPYLKQPLTANQNPWGVDWVYLYNYVAFWGNNNEGYDLTGDGTFDKIGGYNTGNSLVLPGVST
ncbi:MAG: type II secretion system protein GspG, partial [Candidatus Omnitrophota bacterium]